MTDQKRDGDRSKEHERTEVPQSEVRNSEGHGGEGEEIPRAPTPGIREAEQWD